mmetsp:Transcript_69715/g.130129  ORF Transcript_69715/g.130129 Transcript_69715/m.130129 type:complete len:553 (+) Transcript_69715:89-1747(+)
MIEPPALLQPRGLQWFLSKPKAWQRWLIREPWHLPIAAMHLSAVQIQRAWRACWLRKALFRRVHLAATGIAAGLQPPSQDEEGTLSAAGRSWRRVLAHNALKRRHLKLLHSQYGASSAKRVSAYSRAAPSFQDFCASLIQSAWRTHSSRLHGLIHVLRHRGLVLHNVAAFQIQRAFREYMEGIEQAKALVRIGSSIHQGSMTESTSSLQGSRDRDRTTAATKIQRCWRQWQDRKTYNALRSIIVSFRRTGDPCYVLRSILPRESLFLDSSMQIHVRFRLGGSQFPPQIYFKIFTHAPVCDVGAFAPRHYFAEAIYREGKGKVDEHGKWYCREENNGWRPLVSRLPQTVDELKHKSRATRPFHHSRLRRRQDLERRRKQRTVAWMRRIYGLASCDIVNAGSADKQQPMLQPPEEYVQTDVTPRGVPELLSPRPPAAEPTGRPRPTFLRTSTRTSNSSSHSLLSSDVASPKALAGKEFDDENLLEWSKQLDFDAYMNSWQQLGTSDLSDAGLPLTSIHKQTVASAAWLGGTSLPNGTWTATHSSDATAALAAEL